MTTLLEPGSRQLGESRTEIRRPRAGRLTTRLSALGLVPFAAFTLLFLLLPAAAVLWGAFKGNHGNLTMSNFNAVFKHGSPYLQGFKNSLKLAVITSVIPGVLGVVLAYAVHASPGGALLKRIVSTASGVFANFGGVPLAFLFTAVIGPAGFLTSWLDRAFGFSPYAHGFSLFSMLGVELVYLYFQIPLMVLVVTPALAGLRPSWREASDGMGAGSWTYWRLVGLPVLLPSVIGGILLLFGSALAAYATADALTSGSIALTSIQIGSFLNGNVIAGQENVGKALGACLILIVAVVMVVYALLQRRVSKWSR